MTCSAMAALPAWIMKAAAVPVSMSWMWTLAFGHHVDRTPTHGYAATRAPAMPNGRCRMHVVQP